MFDCFRLRAFGDDRDRLEQRGRLAWLEQLGRAGDVGEHLAAGPEDPCALGEASREIDVDEDVAAPDPVSHVIGDGHRLDSRLHDLDVILEAGFGHGALRVDAVLRIHQLEQAREARHGLRPGEISIPAGTTAITEVTLDQPPGTPLFFGCHLPGHWAYGMRGVIRVSS